MSVELINAKLATLDGLVAALSVLALQSPSNVAFNAVHNQLVLFVEAEKQALQNELAQKGNS